MTLRDSVTQDPPCKTTKLQINIYLLLFKTYFIQILILFKYLFIIQILILFKYLFIIQILIIIPILILFKYLFYSNIVVGLMDVWIVDEVGNLALFLANFSKSLSHVIL